MKGVRSSGTGFLVPGHGNHYKIQLGAGTQSRIDEVIPDWRPVVQDLALAVVYQNLILCGASNVPHVYREVTVGFKSDAIAVGRPQGISPFSLQASGGVAFKIDHPHSRTGVHGDQLFAVRGKHWAAKAFERRNGWRALSVAVKPCKFLRFCAGSKSKQAGGSGDHLPVSVDRERTHSGHDQGFAGYFEPGGVKSLGHKDIFLDI